MSELTSQEFIVHNQSELEDLAWELASAEGQFSLMLARCNYVHLRDDLVDHLRQICSVVIRVLVLHPSETALYTRIQDELRGEQPGALMVFGLETVADLEQLLSNANQVREGFRKNCPFPIVLWVTDEVMKGLVHAAPDFESWATKTYFTLPPEALLQSLQQAADSLFTRLLTPGSSQSFEQLRKKMELGFLQRDEVRMAVQDLQRQEQVLEPQLQASLNFARGLNATDGREALEHFQLSLSVWQTIPAMAPTLNAPTTQLKIGLLLFYLGQTTYQLCEQKKQSNWEAARVLLQQCVELFERENRPDLVSKCITQWEQVLWQLKRWDELETVANKALKLHQAAIDSHQPYASLSRFAQDCGFLADVELQRQQWTTAAQFAQLALDILNQRLGEPAWVQSRYLLLLAKAERQLGQLRTAEEHLLQAKSLGDRGQLQTYLDILQELRELYLAAKDYVKAFAAKRERFSIEQQYGIRAFVGAGRLQPIKQAVSLDDPLSLLGMVAPEIAAAGRQQDLDRLLERVERRDYRFIVIHGNSGVGKSSLVDAGLVPTLKQRIIEARGNVPVVIRIYTQWIQELGRLLAEAIGKPALNSAPFTPQTLLEQLRQIDQRNLRTVLIFDQFEEFFFVYPKPENRKPFFDFLTQCLQILSIKVFLSLREDYLHYLLEYSRLEGMKRTGIDILSQNVLYGLGNFDPQDAKAIIQSLTGRARFVLEPALVDQLVEDLAREVGTVRPIELQVVGAQLQEERITTLLQYRDCGQEPKQELVKRYLNGVVADCGAENEQVAELVLFLLTDEKGTRPLKTCAELEKELQALAANSGEPDHSLDLVLQIFVESGLVFLLPEFPADRYQLVHDYLATFIRQNHESEAAKLKAELKQEREQRRLSEEHLDRVQQTQLALSESLHRFKGNQRKASGKKRIWRSLLLGTILASLSLGLDKLGAWEPLEQSTYNALLHARGSIPWDERIVLIAIDDGSLEKLCPSNCSSFQSSFQVSRSKLANLLEILSKASSSVVAIDILMPESSPDDERLAAAIQKHKHVVLASSWNNNGGLLSPNPDLDAEALSTGHTIVYRDLDGVPRKADLQLGKPVALPSLGLAAVQAYKRFNEPEIAIPDPSQPFWLNWFGSLSQVKQYSFIDVIQNKVPLQNFHNKVVLIGYTATGVDELLTPFGRAGGVYFHAAVVNNLLQQNALHRPSKNWLLAILLLAGPGLSLVMVRLNTEKQLIIWIGACFSWGLLSFFLFKANYWLPTSVPIVTMLITGVAIQLAELDKNRLERKTNQELMNLFEESIAPRMLDLITKFDAEDAHKKNSINRDRS